jgi:dTDP-4-amino-4,6-dideoxygalactose transaminase
LPDAPSNIRHAYHLFVIQTEVRKQLYDFLRENKIFAQVHYVPVHMHPYYKNLYGEVTLPKADAYYAQTLSLPMYHSLSDSDLGYVIEKIKLFFSSQTRSGI